jgi:hypothetical protein
MSFCDEMLYAAFRAGFVITLDSMLRESLDRQHELGRVSGFLDLYPILRGTAPQIQLECLLQTWDHIQQGEGALTRFDDCVISAAYDALANMGELTTRPTLSRVWNGPHSMVTASDHWVTSKVRTLKLVANEKTVSQHLRLETPLDERRPALQAFFVEEPQSVSDEMISIVGRWTASAVVVLGSKGLLTDDEQDILRIFFEEQTGLLR